MRNKRNKMRARLSASLLGGASAFALAQPVCAQDALDDDGATNEDVIIVTGIRQSLQASMDVKRESRGVVDAITAEDIGKFPDTNLAESLQRITGVSINRSLGEGSQVTVRGFGPDFNLVLLNGRQMPSAFLTGGAPSSRSFDFGNIAAEGIAGVTVYKTGRAAIPTGGIGSTLNILTARPLDMPGLRFSLGAKAVLDKSVTTLAEQTVTPEISGIFSNTFAEGKIGVLIAGSYQDRESGQAQVGTTSGWRGAFLGSENDWGTLPQPPNDTQVTNRPGPNDIYSVPQNINYQLASFDRERINGQLALQFRPADNLTATFDYFYTRNEIDARRADLSVWFNHGNTTSAWTDGPIADPIFYNEDFGDAGSDLSMGGGRDGSKSENKSFGANVAWDATERLSFNVDFHMSSAESGQNSPFGTSSVVSTADFQLRSQGVNFENEIPVLTLGFQDPFTDIDPARMIATGSVFSNSFIRTEIDQVQFKGSYDFDSSIVSSVDFGATYTKNRVRSAFANAQRDTWGGVGTAADLPDDIFRRVDLASNFDQFSGYKLTQQDFLVFDFDRMIEIIDSDGPPFFNACGGDGVCRSDDFLIDRRIEEESWAGFLDVVSDFHVGDMPAQIIAGVRYETTNVVSPSQVTAPSGAQWVAANEFVLIGLTDPNNVVVQEFTGGYDYFLPAVDFQIDPLEDVKLRASYSKTLTRPGYGDIAGGLTVSQLFRINGGNGTNGNTDLKPFLSNNIDLSAEWYYKEGSYLSVGFFYKDVKNFIGSGVVTQTPFEVYTPVGGARWNAAVAALGSDQDLAAIRQWIFENADPSTFEITGLDSNGNFTGNIFGVPGEDPLLTFDIATPINQRAAELHGWEFAIQHIFGETGFGLIANYTIVNGDVTFDKLQVPSSGDPQFALTGLSDSYNLIGFYDKNGLQARIAYNWRGKFLSSTIGVSGTPNNPLFVEDFGQLDFSASYDVSKKITVFVEGINVLNETGRVVGRSPAYINFATQTGPRYNFGVRYTF
ncbi:TonB-dependent receptor [Amphiplicatus metriothermophilus]|uniref:TonB-dependent receptor n=1 Tax=Amphiplicatus metriothermophilus TaxID=1519374 RepID=A0A239PQP5_9PROT|nr:TonB-dependent receptor [Amphiplicatus metriothermophilus]MBB5518476.1 TonB-dependent receptor [Amphiplicatus metriothermophilus]SNT72363.1 TonB-dependent receptor [Amphiplicatus metriothermophilus]